MLFRSDDHDPDVNPNVTADLCNGVDDDCDGDVDEDPDLSWYLDADADGFGDEGSASFVACDPGSDAYASNDADCDDDSAEVYPGADEVCDGLDNDCSGAADDDPTLFGTWYPDTDMDGYGDATAASTEGCRPGDDWSSSADDCDDDAASVNPAGDETCNGVDDDCNGETDEDESEWTAYYEDADGDGAGVDTLVYGCDAESAGGTDNTWDCDDGNPREPVFVSTLGSSRGDGSLDRPYNMIQAAIDVSTVCVSVAGGTYTEDIDFSGRSISVESQEDSSTTTIEGTGRESVVTVTAGESATLRGFTITGGGGSQSSGSSYYWDGTQYVYYYYAYAYGGGLYTASSTVDLDDVVFVDNLLFDDYFYYSTSTTYYYGYSYGGAMYVYDSAITMTDVDMIGNNAGYGSAFYSSYGSLVGTRVRVQENTDDYYTTYDSYGTQDWENLIVDSNSSRSSYSGFHAYRSTIGLTNATVVGNDYGLLTSYSDVTVDSSIFYDNGTYGLGDYDATASSWVVAYTDVYRNGTDYYTVTDNTGYSGNLSENPGLRDYSDDGDADNDDLTLYAASPCTDGGNPSSAHADVDGSNNDMGAYGGPEATW